MELRIPALSLHLPARRTLRLDSARGTTLRVLAGRLWLAEEGLPDDCFLAAGDRHRVRSDGRVVVQSESASAVELDVQPLATPLSLRSLRPTRPAGAAGASGSFRSTFSALLRSAPRAGT